MVKNIGIYGQGFIGRAVIDNKPKKFDEEWFKSL